MMLYSKRYTVKDTIFSKTTPNSKMILTFYIYTPKQLAEMKNANQTRGESFHLEEMVTI